MVLVLVVLVVLVELLGQTAAVMHAPERDRFLYSAICRGRARVLRTGHTANVAYRTHSSIPWYAVFRRVTITRMHVLYHDSRM